MRAPPISEGFAIEQEVITSRKGVVAEAELRARTCRARGDFRGGQIAVTFIAITKVVNFDADIFQTPARFHSVLEWARELELYLLHFRAAREIERELLAETEHVEFCQTNLREELFR